MALVVLGRLSVIMLDNNLKNDGTRIQVLNFIWLSIIYNFGDVK